MPVVFRWLLRLVTLMIFLIVGTFGLAYYFAARSLPDYNTQTIVPGLIAPVEIVRDNANVPHIFGINDADVYYALGFAHAQDRMWQMTMLRRTAQGRLSELFGKRTLEIDKMIRRFDLYNLAVASVDDQDKTASVALDAYAAGINAWLAEVNAEARGRGAPEMWVFNHPVAPWQAADSLAILKLLALQLSSHLELEVLRARTSLMLPSQRLADLLPDDPSSGIASLPDYAQIVPNLQSYTPNTRMAYGPLNPSKPPAFAGASNAWTASINRSTAGATLMANDPHFGLTAPTLWYLARLELQSGGIIGGTIPGMPVVLTGRSADLGWGLTSSYLDDQDVFLEEQNPNNPMEYRTQDGWVPFRTRESIIFVNDAPAVTVKLKWSVNGPIMPSSLYDLGAIMPAGHVAAIGWTALSDKDTSMSAALAISRAQTVQAAISAAENYIAPSQNLTLADRNQIAMKTIGHFPARDSEHQSKGRFPSYGYLARNQWAGHLPYADNPEFVNPIGGLLGNTNNKISDRPFPNHVSYEWGDNQRIHRWQRLMQSRAVHTRESFIEAQLDTVSFTARSLLPLIGADLWFTGASVPKGTSDRRRQQALDLLAAWNGEMNEHLPEPLLYATWIRHLQDRLIRDEIGPLVSEFTHPNPLFIERVFRNVEGASIWCDVLQSAPIETCSDIALLALDDALVWIDENVGGTVESLRWGDLHQATHDHPVLGTAPILNWFVNIRQSTSGGDHTLQRGLTSGTGPNPFQNVHSAGYRGVYDFADPDSSVFVTSTGQSGHPLSRYYDNLGELWRRGEYIPMSLDPDLARAAAVGVTQLIPAAN